MPTLDDLLERIPISDLAARLGVDETTAAAAVDEAVPALVSALEANAQDPSGAASLERAIAQHSPTLVDGSVNLDDVDPVDGEKIVDHIFGEHKDQVVATLSGGTVPPVAGDGGSLAGELLPILAPIVLSYLAKQFSERKQTAQTVQPTEPMQLRSSAPHEEPTGIGGVLGGLFGGGEKEHAPGGTVGQILSGLLNGGGRSTGGIGDVLGGMLGGGRA